MTERGFSLTEMLVVLALTSIIMVVLMRFATVGWTVSRETRLQQAAVEDARLQLERISKSMREAQVADTGAYALVTMGPQKIEFYSDVDADETTELIRYELVGANLQRGVTEPTGNPLTYNQAANEQVSVVASSIRNGSDQIFTYYTGDYPDDQTALSPVDLTEVKYIQFRLVVDTNTQIDPAAIDVMSQVQLRNLKANLGETL